MITKIGLIGIMGHGKSSVANLFVGKNYFEVGNHIIYTCDKEILSYNNGDIEIFDTRGINGKGETDTKKIQEMIKTFKEEKINSIFIVINGQVCQINEGLKQIIKEICKLFIGKYIWKQIGIIFTHYGYEKEQQEEVKTRTKYFVKEVLDTAEEEYKEIIKNQDENNKTCDSNEKITETLKCFYVNAKRNNDQYDFHTIKEIEIIKNMVKNNPPIDKIQSKFIIKKEILKDQKSEESHIEKKEKEGGFKAGLKTFGCYAFGTMSILATPQILLHGGFCKLIGLPFGKDSYFSREGNELLESTKLIPKLFNEIPDSLNTKINREIHYDLYDVELIYWSDKTVTKNIFNVRPQVVKK